MYPIPTMRHSIISLVIFLCGILMVSSVLYDVRADDCIPGQTVSHTIRYGENLFRISLRYNTTMAAIAAANGITNFDLIYEGQTLVIPCGGASVPVVSYPTPTPAVVPVQPISPVAASAIPEAVITDELNNVVCGQVGAVTQGEILVDVPYNATPVGFNTGCNILTINFEGDDSNIQQGAVGTSRYLRRIPVDYGRVVDAVDVYALGNEVSNFGFFSQPVRVCFRTPTPQSLYVVFTDARYYQEAFDEPARTVQILSPVPAGFEKGYACGDITVPGTVSLVTSLPVVDVNNPLHPYAPLPRPDRCLYNGDPSCVG
jgi:LysM repeat protein